MITDEVPFAVERADVSASERHGEGIAVQVDPTRRRETASGAGSRR